MSSIAFADIRLEVSDKDARTAFGQIGLNSLEVRTKPSGLVIAPDTFQ